jgi:hypothetical protein
MNKSWYTAQVCDHLGASSDIGEVKVDPSFTPTKPFRVNKHSESIAKAIQVPNRSHQIQTCNQYQYTSQKVLDNTQIRT